MHTPMILRTVTLLTKVVVLLFIKKYSITVHALLRHPGFDTPEDRREKNATFNKQQKRRKTTQKEQNHQHKHQFSSQQQQRHIIQQEHINNIFNERPDNERQRPPLTDRTSLPTPSEHEVTKLPLLSDGIFSTKHFAGHISAAAVSSSSSRRREGMNNNSTEQEKRKLFYWLFAPDDDRGTNFGCGSGVGGDERHHADKKTRKMNNNNNKKKKNRKKKKKDKNKPPPPLLIWLNGGPGCSSMDGLFLENGPLRLRRKKDKENGKKETDEEEGKEDDDEESSWSSSAWEIDINPYSWHRAPAWVLYVDQPVGTGLSFDRDKNWAENDDDINTDFYNFLVRFLKVYSDFFLDDSYNMADDGDNGDNGDNSDGDSDGNGDDHTKTKSKVNNSFRYRTKVPVYFSGESYAGRYISTMMDHILRMNGDDKDEDEGDSNDSTTTISSDIYIDLRGGVIGSGWISPYHQYAATEVAFGFGFIDTPQKVHIDAKEQHCHDLMQGGAISNKVCNSLLNNVLDSSGKGSDYTVCPYDSRLWEKDRRTFPKGHKVLESYLGGWTTKSKGYADDLNVNMDEVLQAIHATEAGDNGQRYSECTNPPYYALTGLDGTDVLTEIGRVLDHSSRPKLLFYNGLNDLIVNHVGTMRALDNIPWRGGGAAADVEGDDNNGWVHSKRQAWWGKYVRPSLSDCHKHKQGNKDGPSGYIRTHKNLAMLKLRDAGHMFPMDQPKVALEMIQAFLFGGTYGDGGLSPPRDDWLGFGINFQWQKGETLLSVAANRNSSSHLNDCSIGGRGIIFPHDSNTSLDSTITNSSSPSKDSTIGGGTTLSHDSNTSLDSNPLISNYTMLEDGSKGPTSRDGSINIYIQYLMSAIIGMVVGVVVVLRLKERGSDTRGKYSGVALDARQVIEII